MKILSNILAVVVSGVSLNNQARIYKMGSVKMAVLDNHCHFDWGFLEK